jgi:PAS domain S-box-containing protein
MNPTTIISTDSPNSAHKAACEFEQLFDLSLDLMCIAGTDGYFKRVNRAFEKHLGWSSEELLSKTYFEFIHPSDIAHTFEHIKVLAHNQPIEGFDLRLKTSSGAYRTFSLTASAKDGTIFVVGSDVTEQRQTSDENRQGLDRFRMVVEGAGDGLWDWNPQTNLTYYSSLWKQMLGYGESELANTHEEWEKLVHPDDLERVNEHVRKTLEGEGNETFQVTYRMRKRDGTYIFVLDRGRVVSRDENNRAIRVMGTHTDVTQQHLMQEQLKEQARKLDSTARMRDVADIMAHLGSWEIDLQTGKVAWSDQMYTIFGYDKRDFEPKRDNAFERMVSADRARITQAMYHAISTFKAPITRLPEDDVEVVLPGGVRRYLRGAGVVVADVDGNPAYMRGSLQDVTERKRIEQELVQQKTELEKFKLAVFGASDHIVIADSNGSIVYVNPAAQTITGYGHDELLGTRIGHKWAVPGPDAAYFEQMLNEVAKSHTKQVGIVRAKRRNGQEYMSEVHVAPIVNEQGQVVYYVEIEHAIKHAT